MKTPSYLLKIAFPLILGSQAFAAPSVEDRFITGGTDYAENLIVDQGPAALGFIGNWLPAYSTAQSPTVIAAGLSYSDGTNTMTTSGGAVEYAAAGNGRAGRRLSQTYNNATSGSVYFSVLIKLDANATGYRGFELHSGGFDDGNNRQLQIVTGEPGAAATDSSFVLRLLNDTTTLAVDLGEGDDTVNLFVGRINFGPDPQDDVITLWRNPEDLKSEANSTIDATLANFDIQFDRVSFARFGNDGLIFDEVRFGSSWSDATTVFDPADTDNDKMLDVYEMANGLTVGIDDSMDDLDMDDSLNKEEHDRNTRANVFDTDGDDIRDGWERGTAFVNNMQTGTNPLIFDTDMDGIRDGYETNSLVMETPPLVGTSPLLFDTDMDTESDGVEVREGTSPIDGGESSASLGRVIVDGTRDALYSDTLAVQTIQTGFGDNQSEWNAAYAYQKEGNLYLMFTGNLEANFNKLEIFIDSKSTGSTTFTSAGNDNAANMNGMLFDSSFAPDYHLIARRGSGKFDLDFADLITPNFSSYLDIFAGSDTGIATTATGINQSAIRAAYDPSNVGGIGGSQGAAADQTAALSVTTGLEICIALSDIGSPASDIRVMLLQNNSNHDFLSNQTLGGLPVSTQNLAAPAGINFNNFTGDQFFTIPNGGISIVEFFTDLGSNLVELGVTGLTISRPYHVQRSSDLINWSFVEGSNFTATGTFEERLITTDAIANPQVFYRVSEGNVTLP
jgi:hypothetical protein